MPEDVEQTGPITDTNAAVSRLLAAMGGDAEEQLDPTPDEGDEAAPPEEASSGEDQEAKQPDPAETPLIEAPASWSKDAREIWSTIPPEAQSVIAEREKARDTEVRRAQNDAAERRRADEAAATQTTQNLQAWHQQLSQLAAAAQQQFQDQFADVDWQKLSREDPAAYVQLYHQFQVRQATLNGLAGERQKIEQKQRDDAEKASQTRLANEAAALAEAVPDFKDPAKRQVINAEIATYLKARGFSADEMGTIADHRTMLVILDALRAGKLEAARQQTATRVAAAPPKAVLKPSAPTAPDESAQRQAVDARKTLSRARSTADQAAALARIL